MASDMEKAVQDAFRGLFTAKDETQDLLQAFEAFMQAFVMIKADNEAERAARATEFKAAMKEMRAKIAALANGKDGKTPIAGIDYPSREQFAKILEAMRPKTPEAGVDYFVPTKEEIVAACLELMEPTDIFAALFAAPMNVVTAINTAENQIKAERVEGLEQLINEVRKKRWPPSYMGAGQASASTTTPISWKTPAEAPNGSTTVFTVTSVPVDLVADGVQLFSGVGYTYAAGQITFINPPAEFVRYR